MKKSQVDFLDLFFNEGEEISVSDSKYSFHSVTRDEIESNEITLKSPPSDKHPDGFSKIISTDQITAVCINPIKGWKRDENVTNFRSFLIELDDIPLNEQKEYIDKSGIPYSVCVYSGNKSLHYGIVLESDLPNYKIWLGAVKWIHNILDKADQQNISPTRAFRFPDNVRPDGLKKKQALIEIKSRVTIDELWDWLNKHKDKKPKKTTYNEEFELADSVSSISVWSLPTSILDTLRDLKNGKQEYRNKSWFNLACFMAKKGVVFSETVRVFGDYFIEDTDFNAKEWISALRSGYKHINKDT